jgi:ATP-dependent protease ClpP protease subunit
MAIHFDGTGAGLGGTGAGLGSPLAWASGTAERADTPRSNYFINYNSPWMQGM